MEQKGGFWHFKKPTLGVNRKDRTNKNRQTLKCTARSFDMSEKKHQYQKKSRIRETKHFSTDADSSTDTTVGWTKNTPKPTCFEKQKKIIQNPKNSKTSKNMPKLAWFPGGPRIPQNPNCLKNWKNHPKRKKNSKISRNTPKLAIRPSTRGLLSIEKRGFHLVL